VTTDPKQWQDNTGIQGITQETGNNGGDDRIRLPAFELGKKFERAERFFSVLLHLIP